MEPIEKIKVRTRNGGPNLRLTTHVLADRCNEIIDRLNLLSGKSDVGSGSDLDKFQDFFKAMDVECNADQGDGPWKAKFFVCVNETQFWFDKNECYLGTTGQEFQDKERRIQNGRRRCR